jgi:monoamine oxidase
MRVRKMHTVVIGAGVAGLLMAEHAKARGDRVTVLESNSEVGGRTVSRIKDKHEWQFDLGAWRVHSTHRRMLGLLARLQIEAIPFETNAVDTTPPPHPPTSGLSRFDGSLLRYDGNLVHAYRDEAATGYVGQHHGAAASYSVAAAGTFYGVAGGFQQVALRLATTLGRRVKLGRTVLDVTRAHGHYVVHGTNAEATQITPFTLRADRLVVAVPPHIYRKWSIARPWLEPVAASVTSRPLHHVYATLPKGKLPSARWFATHRRWGASVLQQSIAPTMPPSRWFQVAYAAGDAAEFWNRIKWSPSTKVPRLKALLAEWSGLPLQQIESCHWTHAVHAWQPVPRFRPKRAVAQCVVPHPVALPNLTIVGEAHSSVQGWCEGALETVALAQRLLDDPAGGHQLYRTIPSHCVAVHGRVLDVKAWAKVHPGSAAAILKRLGTDVTAVFEHVTAHGDLTWAVLLAHQVGFLKQ